MPRQAAEILLKAFRSHLLPSVESHVWRAASARPVRPERGVGIACRTGLRRMALGPCATWRVTEEVAMYSKTCSCTAKITKTKSSALGNGLNKQDSVPCEALLGLSEPFKVECRGAKTFHLQSGCQKKYCLQKKIRK